MGQRPSAAVRVVGTGLPSAAAILLTLTLTLTHCLLPSLDDLEGGSLPPPTDAGDGGGGGDDGGSTDADGGVREIELGASELRRPLAITLDATRIYWINGEVSGAVLSCPKTTIPCPTPIVIVAGEPSPYAITVN